MEGKEFSLIRHYLGKTQSELARLLCVSAKAVQSFEEEWREIPAYAERQILFLLSMKRSTSTTAKPCWKIKNCPEEWRNKCIVWEYKAGYFCWFLNGTYCKGQCQKTWAKKIQICRQCEVLQTMIPPVF